jgi:hypothetical protein
MKFVMIVIDKRSLNLSNDQIALIYVKALWLVLGMISGFYKLYFKNQVARKSPLIKFKVK